MSDSEQAKKEPRRISDAQTMRALAHPVRLELLDLMRREGALTATRAAEALGESPGNMSWHLQTLARYGFVEDSGEGKGRSRPWRLVADRNDVTADAGDPGASAAVNALADRVLGRAVGKQHEWLTRRPGYSRDWQEAAFLADSIAYLIADELVQVREEIIDIFTRYDSRRAQGQRPEDALPVQLTAFGHPLPATESGN